MPSSAFLSDAQKAGLADGVLGQGDPDDGQQLRRADMLRSRLGIVPCPHTGDRRGLDTNDDPALKPAWGTLDAIDLNTMEFK